MAESGSACCRRGTEHYDDVLRRSSQCSGRDCPDDAGPRTRPDRRPAALAPTPSTLSFLPPAARTRGNDVPPADCSITALSRCDEPVRTPAVGDCADGLPWVWYRSVPDPVWLGLPAGYAARHSPAATRSSPPHPA